jgi:hypothetical protein
LINFVRSIEECIFVLSCVSRFIREFKSLAMRS